MCKCIFSYQLMQGTTTLLCLMSSKSATGWFQSGLDGKGWERASVSVSRIGFLKFNYTGVLFFNTWLFKHNKAFIVACVWLHGFQTSYAELHVHFLKTPVRFSKIDR